jgi:hypothetical protein
MSTPAAVKDAIIPVSSFYKITSLHPPPVSTISLPIFIVINDNSSYIAG